VAAKKKRKRQLMLGQTSFRATGGQQANVSVRLSAAGKKLLSHGKRLKVLAKVTAADAAGNSASSSTPATLKAGKGK
jgi:hypothetical protein